MGSGNSKTKTTKKDREVINNIKLDKIDKVNKNIENLQFSLVNTKTSTDLVTVKSQEQTNQILKTTFVAQTQLNKGGNVFTKDDMLAIFLYIKTASTGTNAFEGVNEFKGLTRDDLVSAIRTIVYDPIEISKLLTSKVQTSEVNNVIPDKTLVVPDKTLVVPDKTLVVPEKTLVVHKQQKTNISNDKNINMAKYAFS